MPSKPSSFVIKLLKEAGWKLKSIEGSHHQYENPETGVKVTIPHPKKDLKPGLLKSIERTTGIKIL